MGFFHISGLKNEMCYTRTRCFANSKREKNMSVENELMQYLNKPISEAEDKELYNALNDMVLNRAANIQKIRGKKKVYYISAEFLIGKQLGKNLINLGIYDEVNQLLENNGKTMRAVEAKEQEPSLGNGGLGRLAACFLDSIATLGMEGDGVGLNYHFGLFKQQFRDHKQYEIPDEWFSGKNMLRKTDVSFEIELAGNKYTSVMYDMDVIGYNNGKNTLHLFDLETVDESIVHDGIQFNKQNIAKNLTLFLYPDDSDRDGQLLRIYQQYFMVANAAQLILKEEREKGHDIRHLDHYVSIQINDTHPSMIIPELIRLMIAQGITMKQAVEIVTRTCGYTNHTILAEALEKWPLDYLMEVVPQLVPIIEALDFAMDRAYSSNPDLAIIDDQNRVHMAKLDMHFSHSINGVAALHTEILKHQELKPFYNIYASKFNNKTNGITFRRFLMHANHELASLLDDVIDVNWRNDANYFEQLLHFYNDEDVLKRLGEIKYANKVRCAEFIKDREGIDIDPNSIFDVQIKRMHEYKRQQMNALWVIYKYLQIKRGVKPQTPVTVIFGGKAAPAYYMAKNVIHLILCLQELINNDPDVSPWMKVVMVTNYNVHKAEILVPACDISEQISLASKEASGTGNMKFMLNGAVTLGTADGANVEIRNLVGNDNIYIFGKQSDEVIGLYSSRGYHPREYYDRSHSIRECVDFITGWELCNIGDWNMLNDLKENLINKDWFMTLLDLEDYCRVKEIAMFDYEETQAWRKKSLVNIAKAGFFSSDRTISDYNYDIWHIQ